MIIIRSTRSGFSLIELMVIIAVAITLTMLIGLNISYLKTAQANNELSLLYSRMLALQSMAIASGQLQYMQFLPAEQGYTWDNHFHHFPDTVRFGLIKDILGPPSHPATAIINPITFSDNVAIFYPDGIIKPGTIYLLDHHNHLHALSCGVGAVSFLRRYRYAEGWKLLDA